MYKAIIFIIVAISAISCEEVPVTLPEPASVTPGKVILIEDVTGVDCSNCPRAVRRLEEIGAQFPGSIILVGIHGSQQTAPIPDKSVYDFRNDDAIFLEEYLKPWNGKPSAIFNRRQFTDEQNFGISLVARFQPRVEELLQEPLFIEITPSYSYDSETRALRLTAEVENVFGTVLEGDFKISAMILESHIIDYQLDSDFGGYDPNYEHNHVLRDVISNVTGDDFAAAMVPGEVLTKTWNYTVPTDDQGLWNDENLELVVFVTDETDGSKEVLQAAKIKIAK